MMILQSNLQTPTGLVFSPDGLSLLAVEDSNVQVWPRWLEAKPLPVTETTTTLERFGFGPAGDRLFLYRSGNSFTRMVPLATQKELPCGVPSAGPSWFSSTPECTFFIACHGRGNLSRYNFVPGAKRAVKTWTVERRKFGSHYRFGMISGENGVFIALEYKFGRGEPVEGLVTRSVTDGKQLRHEKVTDDDAHLLLEVGLKLAIHPSGRYFAFPQTNRVRLWPLADAVDLPKVIKNTSQAVCHAVAFHPSGHLLATIAGTLVKLYDTTTWKVTRQFAWKIGQLRSVCFSPDGSRAAVIGTGEKKTGGKVVVWDMD